MTSPWPEQGRQADTDAPWVSPPPPAAPAWSASPPPAPQYGNEPAWVAYTPDLAPDPSTTWEVPPGFIPLRPPRRQVPVARYLAALGIAAVLAGVGWAGYEKISDVGHNAQPVVTAANSYTSTEGGFTVSFPEPPTTTTETRTVGMYTVTVYMAADASEEQIAAGFSISPAVPSDRMPLVMRSDVVGMSSGASIVSMSDGTYQQHPSITATLRNPDGSLLRVLIYAVSGSRMYLLLAGDDAKLQTLESRFQALP